VAAAQADLAAREERVKRVEARLGARAEIEAVLQVRTTGERGRCVAEGGWGCTTAAAGRVRAARPFQPASFISMPGAACCLAPCLGPLPSSGLPPPSP